MTIPKPKSELVTLGISTVEWKASVDSLEMIRKFLWTKGTDKNGNEVDIYSHSGPDDFSLSYSALMIDQIITDISEIYHLMMESVEWWDEEKNIVEFYDYERKDDGV